MLQNIKTTELVRNALQSDLYLLEVLKEDLVNVSALSRKLLSAIKKKNPKATLESISMAIKRYIESEKGVQLSQTAREIIASSQLSTRNDVLHVTLKRNDRVLEKIAEIARKVQWDQEEVFLVNQGQGEVTLILDEKNHPYLDSCENEKIEETRNLALLSIRESFRKGLPQSIKVPGIYAYFLNQLARHSMNVLEIISTFSQLTLVLKKEDLMNAYALLDANINYLREKR